MYANRLVLDGISVVDPEGRDIMEYDSYLRGKPNVLSAVRMRRHVPT